MSGISIGAISSGTLRFEDLSEAFLACFRIVSDDSPKATSFANELEDILSLDTLDPRRGDMEVDFMIDLGDEINASIPTYLRFGTIDGDPACWGIWENDMLPEGVAEMLLIADTTDSNDVEIDALRTVFGLMYDALDQQGL